MVTFSSVSSLSDTKQLRWEAEQERKGKRADWRGKRAQQRGAKRHRGGGGGAQVRGKRDRKSTAVKKQYRKVFKQNRNKR